MKSEKCLIARYVSWVDEETPALMKDRVKRAIIKAWHHQIPPLQPGGQAAGI